VEELRVTAEHVKRVHRQFPTGVTIVTTMVDGAPYGLAVNAFASISLEPPLVLVCVAETSSTYPRLFLGDTFAVNVLAHDQAGLVDQFARSGGDKFSGVAWRQGSTGCPILNGTSAYLELEVHSRLPAYTHTIFVGRVLDAGVSDVHPLVYFNGTLYSSADLRAIPRD
jgi:flavin reductase (DIM6/NTAB) family NADH-FMN oxidoreductase RutF